MLFSQRGKHWLTQGHSASTFDPLFAFVHKRERSH